MKKNNKNYKKELKIIRLLYDFLKKNEEKRKKYINALVKFIKVYFLCFGIRKDIVIYKFKVYLKGPFKYLGYNLMDKLTKAGEVYKNFGFLKNVYFNDLGEIYVHSNFFIDYHLFLSFIEGVIHNYLEEVIEEVILGERGSYRDFKEIMFWFFRWKYFLIKSKNKKFEVKKRLIKDFYENELKKEKYINAIINDIIKKGKVISKIGNRAICFSIYTRSFLFFSWYFCCGVLSLNDLWYELEKYFRNYFKIEKKRFYDYYGSIYFYQNICKEDVLFNECREILKEKLKEIMNEVFERCFVVYGFKKT